MPKKKFPRTGSLQFWPRKRSKSIIPRVRAYPELKEAKLTGFAGYKVGMIQASFTESRKTSPYKGQDVVIPVTIVECPPIRIYSIRLYAINEDNNVVVTKEIVADNIDKTMKRTLPIPKSPKTKELIDSINIDDYEDIRVNVYTQPKLTSLGKKKPELFEMALGGNKNDKWEYAKSILGKEIPVSDIFKDNELVDVHAVTTGKGFQGPVKRFGVAIRFHKSEKTKRGPGSLGSWDMRGKKSWTVAHAGQMGFHLRTDINKLILKVIKSNEAKELNPKSGIRNYGLIKNDIILMKGSLPGPKKRFVKFFTARRPNDKLLIPANTNVEVLANF